MIKRIFAALLALAILAALMPASLADSGDIQPYKGWVGADSPLYTIKVYIQQADVFFTFNDTAKMIKQMNYADERLSEAEAMALANDTGSLNRALDEYQSQLDDLNNTTQAPDIDPNDYANLSPMLYHHQQCFYGMMNNSTAPMNIEGRLLYMCNQTIKMKNGMPFYYYNNTSYFIPPGQMNKAGNGSRVPPGLARKGYVRPVPTITNGSMKWPWDDINYTYANKTMPSMPAMPTMPAMPSMPPMKNNGHGIGNGNGNHGNGNGHK